MREKVDADAKNSNRGGDPRVEAVIVNRVEVPVYLRIAEKARRLRELEMSDKAITRALGVSDKTGRRRPGRRTLGVDVDSFIGEVHGYKKQG